MMNYIQTERINDIERLIQQQSIIKISDLTKKFNVSSETIRRDLSELENRGVLRRVHGGAVRVNQLAEEPPFQSRQVIHLEEKGAIARAVADLIVDGDSLILDVGTTVQEVARRLVDKSDLFVVTNSSVVAGILSPNKSHKIVLLGGELRADELSTHGPIAIEQVRRFIVNKAILGAGGITEEAITDFHFEQALLRREMICRSKETVFAIDSSKFGATALHQICKPSEINLIVTDRGVKDNEFGMNLSAFPLMIAEGRS